MRVRDPHIVSRISLPGRSPRYMHGKYNFINTEVTYTCIWNLNRIWRAKARSRRLCTHCIWKISPSLVNSSFLQIYTHFISTRRYLIFFSFLRTSPCIFNTRGAFSLKPERASFVFIHPIYRKCNKSPILPRVFKSARQTFQCTYIHLYTFTVE